MITRSIGSNASLGLLVLGTLACGTVATPPPAAPPTASPTSELDSLELDPAVLDAAMKAYDESVLHPPAAAAEPPPQPERASVPGRIELEQSWWGTYDIDALVFAFGGDAAHPALMLYEVEFYDTRRTLSMQVIDPATKGTLVTVPPVTFDAAGAGQFSSPESVWTAAQAAIDDAFARFHLRPATRISDVGDDGTIRGPNAGLVVRLEGTRKVVATFEVDGKRGTRKQAFAPPSDVRKHCRRSPIGVNLIALNTDATMPWAVAEVRFWCDDPESSDTIERDLPVVIDLVKPSRP